MEEAVEEVMVESERNRIHSMMGMFGLDPNKLDFDYEKHFTEHDLPPSFEEVNLPPRAYRMPRPVRAALPLNSLVAAV